MVLFEVQRLVAAWPSLRNIQKLRELISNDEVVVSLIPDRHIVIGWGHQDESLGGYAVYLFDQVPLNSQCDDCDPVMVSSPLVDVLVFSDTMIGLLCASGVVHVMEFNRLTCQWEDHGYFQLSCGSGYRACQAIINGCGHIVYVVREGDDNWSHSVYVDSLLSVSGSYQVNDHTLLLSHCPSMELFVVSNGVWMVPASTGPTPPNVMAFYNDNDKDIKSHVFSCTNCSSYCVQYEDDVETIRDYKTICRRSAWKWRKASEMEEYIVSVCVHSVSHDLLVLMNDGRIFRLKLDNGGVRYIFLVKLVDFIDRYPLPKPWFTMPSSKPLKSSYSSLELFSCYTYLGICLHGELRLYDSATGEFVWECDDLDHTSTRMISASSHYSTSIPLPLVLLNKSGMYFLRCKRIVDHAHMFVDSLFPIATNADETTPGAFLKDGELYAAHVCDLWGLSVMASHYTVTLAYQVFKGKNVAPSLQPELLNQLQKVFNQSPSLCVALMAQYPICHRFLLDCLNKCLVEKDILTTLESETVPLLMRYLELSQKLEALMKTPIQAINNNLPVKSRVSEILTVSQQFTGSTDPTADLRAELLFLCSSNPHEALIGIKEFMEVKGPYSEALKTGSYSPDVNWRNLFSSELAEKASLTSMKTSVQVTRLPVFEMVCNLLYQIDPNDLIHFVAFAHMVRETQHGESSFIRRTIKKEYFYQRAVEAIPQPDERSTNDQIGVFSELCLLSDCANVELEALSLLLKSNMWEKVVVVLKGLRTEVPSHLNSALFHRSMLRFSTGGVLHLFISQLWELLPKTFSILDFIEVLKSFKHEENEVLTTTKQLSISEVAPYVLHLLAQENNHKQQHKAIDISCES